MIKKLGCILVLCLLASCSLKPVKLELLNNYVLSSASQVRFSGNQTPLVILVSEPSANPGYQSTSMVYVTSPYRLQRYVRNMWVAPPAQLLMPLVKESLENTNKFHGVVAVPYSGDVDYRVNTHLVMLQQEMQQSHAQIHAVIQFAIVGYHSNKMIASKRFESIVPLQRNTPYDGVIAANKAVNTLLSQMSSFVVKTLR